ncbi:MAG: NAD-dependent epimerase/dehydratase family protein [Ruminococcus sp.]
MKKKIIIFGATGGTGVYLIEYLNKNINLCEYELIAVGRRKTDYFDKYNIDYYSVDISQQDTLLCLPRENIYAIIILAGILPAKMKGYVPQAYIDINVRGILNIMEFYKNSSLDRVIYTISISDLHGYLPKQKEFLPDMPINYKYGTDHTIYAISKTAATEIIKTYYFDYGIKYYILRLPNIYMYSTEKEYYVDGIPKKISYRYLIDRAIEGKDLELWGNPEQKREIVYVKDFCQFVYRTLFADADVGYYNVGADCMVSMRDQIMGIINVFCPENHKSKIVYCPEKPSCDDTHMNIDKAKKELGYSPKYGYIDYLIDYKKEMNSDRFINL